ncbi:MAG: DUF222 domain-containing protein [Candidatus Nanopelagicales bacterium]
MSREAFTAGRIGTRQVLALQHAASRIEDFGVHEKHLVQVAERVDPKELRRLLDVLITQSIPEHADLELDKQHSKRGVSLNERQDGMWKLDGLLDAIAGNKLNDLLQPLMAKEGADDPRGPKQRRADALDDVVSLARASRSPLGVSGLSVLVDIDTLPGRCQSRAGRRPAARPRRLRPAVLHRGHECDLRAEPAQRLRTAAPDPHF